MRYIYKRYVIIVHYGNLILKSHYLILSLNRNLLNLSQTYHHHHLFVRTQIKLLYAAYRPRQIINYLFIFHLILSTSIGE